MFVLNVELLLVNEGKLIMYGLLVLVGCMCCLGKVIVCDKWGFWIVGSNFVG